MPRRRAGSSPNFAAVPAYSPYGLQTCLPPPGEDALFTALTVPTLAIGIGANSAIFSVIDGILLHPMALGARAHQVRVLLLKQGAALVMVGLVLGASGALALARVFAAYSDILARSFGNRGYH